MVRGAKATATKLVSKMQNVRGVMLLRIRRTPTEDDDVRKRKSKGMRAVTCLCCDAWDNRSRMMLAVLCG